MNTPKSVTIRRDRTPVETQVTLNARTTNRTLPSIRNSSGMPAIVASSSRLATLEDMSHAVPPEGLAEAAQDYAANPFLLYSSTDGSARVNHVLAEVRAEPPTIVITGFGRGVIARVSNGAKLSVLWPAQDSTSFSLIADGYGRLEGDELIIDVESAVLHRPAPSEGTARC